ncbi:uncharacterized protein LOC108051253 [Drosophila rhopaloa]|uniref:Uncharacterized protein LOC108051253 n=1 Tax=Drosophila rhopaloa TaxID=1041015 RepID=A0A6P4FHN8_DRORH|nr:uncharacterized protein LOC108051253 [Drosophila rhopaloa]
MACYWFILTLLPIGLILEWNSVGAKETTEVTWPEDITEATLETEMTWPNELPEIATQPPVFRIARTMDHLDALRDEEEFMEKPDKNHINEIDSLEVTHRIVYSAAEIKALKRKPLPEEKLIRQPFHFGCCHNSTYVECAGVCPETCEYRSKYCVPLCGPPCRCKTGYVYNIPRKACTLRSDCPKGIVQSKKGVYRVFL